MSGFIRVRAASGPRHKFYAPSDWVAAHPELYVVLDKESVSKPGPVEYVVKKPVSVKSQIDGYVEGMERAAKKMEPKEVE